MPIIFIFSAIVSGIAAVMLLLVTGLGVVIVRYSRTQLQGDPGQPDVQRASLEMQAAARHAAGAVAAQALDQHFKRLLQQLQPAFHAHRSGQSAHDLRTLHQGLRIWRAMRLELSSARSS